MSLISKARRQRTMVWKATGTNQFSAVTYAPPTTIPCRWDGGDMEKTSRDGAEIVYNTSVMLEVRWPLNSRLLLVRPDVLGEVLGLTEQQIAAADIEDLLTGVTDAFETEPPPQSRPILGYKETPNLKAKETLFVALL